MNKSELLENYTAEQLAEMVVECEIVKKQCEISTNWEKTMPEHELKAKFNQQTAKIQYENERLKTVITQIDEILEELFGVTHEAAKPGEFKEILTDKIIQNIADFLPAEPIKVADMLISAEGEYERHLIAKAICGTDKGAYRIFDVADLRQIAEHLLVYCNANGEMEE